MFLQEDGEKQRENIIWQQNEKIGVMMQLQAKEHQKLTASPRR